MVTERISQCIERTLMYIKCYGVPWDFQSTEIQEVISPDPLMQLYTAEQASLLRIANNQEEKLPSFGNGAWNILDPSYMIKGSLSLKLKKV